MTVPAPLERLCQPEYTGENRCLPCTLVNLAIVAIVSATAGLWHWLGGLLAVTIGIALLVLRGYVVPGTPRFAPRLVAPLPVDFGHSDRSPEPLSDIAGADPSEEPEPEQLLAPLVEAGVLESDGEDLFLEIDFRERWQDRMATLRTAEDEEFADRVAAACEVEVDVHRQGERLILAGDHDVRTSRAVAIAETAAVEVLEKWEVPEPIRARAATPLRTFLRTCPACGGPIEETTIRHCCGGRSSIYERPEQPVLACADCESVVIEL